MHIFQNQPPHPGPPAQRLWRTLGLFSVALITALLILVYFLAPHTTYENPLLLAFLNTIFLCLIPLWVAYVAARSHQSTGYYGYLLISAGLLTLALSSLYAGWLLPLAGSPNPTVTIHNLGALLAGLCQIEGVHLFVVAFASDSSKPRTPYQHTRLLYTAILLLITLAALLAYRGSLPTFIDPLTGPSPLRQIILVTAICLFSVAGLAYLEFSNLLKTEFAYWYGLGLWLIAIGLDCILVQPGVGSLLGWVGRASQYLGSLYLLAAFLQGRAEGAVPHGPNAATWVLWPALEQRVHQRTADLLDLNQALQREISGHHLAETALRESETRFSTIFHASRDAIAISRLTDGTYLDVNESFSTTFELTRHQVIGHTAAELNLWTNLQHRETFIQAIRAGNLDADFEAHYHTPSGKHGWILISGSLATLAGQACLITIGKDITTRKLAQEQLLEAKDRFNKVFRSSPIGINIVRISDQRSLDANDAFLDLIGRTRPELIGHTAPELGLFEELLQDTTWLDTLLKTGTVRGIDAIVRQPTGQIRQAILSMEQFELDGQPTALVLSFDVTDRKRAETALLAAHSELEQRVTERTAQLQTANLALEKALHTRDQFMATMSHEMRTPLTGVLGLAEILQLPSYGPLTEKQLNAVLNIEHSGQRLLKVINDVLDYTLLQSGSLSLNLRPCPLDYACQTALSALAHITAKKQQHTHFQSQPENITITTDERYLNRILASLLHNATKFTPNGGEIGIELLGDPHTRTVALTIWDTGIGIQETDLPRLFQPFVQLDAALSRQYEGTGLGLALVKLNTQLLSGTVHLQSTPGHGSRFTVTLPWN